MAIEPNNGRAGVPQDGVPGGSPKRVMFTDTLFYLAAKTIEGVVGIAATSLYTFLFSKEIYGRFALLNVVITAGGMLCIQWLAQPVYRYLSDYLNNGRLKDFYSTAFFLWLIVNGAAVLLGGGFILLANTLCAGNGWLTVFNNNYPANWLTLAVLMFVSYNTAQILTSLLAAHRAVKLNLFLSAFAVAGKLAGLFVLSKLFGARIEWILLTSFIFDSCVSAIALCRLGLLRQVSRRAYSPDIQRSFIVYGVPLIGNILTITILNSSDRFFIGHYGNAADVGVYTINYSLISAAFTVLSYAVMRGTYPTILRAWSAGRREDAKRLISHAVRGYLLIGAPAVAGVAALCYPMAHVLFKRDYAAGFLVMPFVAGGMLFSALTEYSNKPWELTARTHIIFRNSVIASAVNIAANIVLVPRFGYIAAACSTLGAFLFLYILSKAGSSRHIRWTLTPLVYARIILSAGVMAVSVYFIGARVGSVPGLAAAVAAGAVIYAVLLFVSGEIRGEAREVFKKLTRR